MKTNQLFERLWEHGRTLRRVGLVLVMCLTLCTNVWGASVAEGIYNFVDQTIGAKNEFYKIDNGIYQYRLNGYSRNSNLGIQLPNGTGDGTGFAFHLESTQKVYIGIVKKSVKREVTNNLYIKTITEANFSAIEAGSNSSTTVTLTLGGSATLSGNYTFAGISSPKTEGATVYMGELPAGYYYAYGNSSNGEGYLYSISFGTQTLFLVPNDKTSDNAKFAIYYWMGASGYERQGWSDYMTVSPCNSSTYRADIPKGYTKVIFVRLDPSKGKNWDGKWNQTGNLTFDGSKDLFTWANGSWDGASTTWSASTKYTISFAANGGTGSMSNVSSIACGRSVKLAANAYTKSGYVFAGWKTNVAVTANGEAVAANGIVPEGATISNITSNITLTAQWNADVACTATQPGALSKGTLSGCSRTITASGSPETNNTWYWQSSSTGTDKSDAYSLGKAITAAGTYYLRSYCSTGSGCWSDAVSVEITAADMTPSAPTALTKSSITAKGVTLTVEDAANTNDYEFYVSTSSPAPGGSTPATHSSNTKSLTITNLYAGTTFYAWARAKCGSNKSAWTALTGSTFTTSTVSVTHTLTNVTKTSGATTAGGSDYTAEFAAVSGYSMPNPTVTIGGNAATSGTHYTWSVEGAVGTITIPANKINGNIAITLNSADAAPSSATISGAYHYFPGENISLTVTPSGNNGPTTYQWYKGGKADGNRIDGATSATYTKNSCAFADAGSYYCKVTCNATSIWANTNSYENYDVKILRLYVKGSKGGQDYGNVDFVKVNSTTATASISLGSNWTYGFNIADGCGHYYGNAGTMQENNCTNWTTNVNGTDCGLTTTNAATYIFTINYSSLEAIVTSVTYPVGNQAAGKVIYFDNNDRAWTSVYYRIGKSTHSQADQLSLVPGTANLYKMTTREYNGFSAWQIGNAEGGNGSNKSIYNTKNTPAITASIAYEGASVTADAVTVTPGVDHSTGGSSDNNNCEFYSKTITDGMKTQNVSITAPSNGTLTVNYVDVSGAAQAFSSGNRDLAHTCIITVTAVPAAGYSEPATVSINGASHGNRDPYTITGTTVVAATFSPASYTVTLNTNGGTINAGNVTSYTYGIGATLPTNVTKDGFTFDGWYDNSGLTGSAVTTISTTATGNKEYWAKWTPVAATYTVTYNAQGGSVTPSSETVSTATLPTPTKSGYTFDGWYTSGGSKITGTYNPTVDITLYAQWQSTDCDAGGTTTLVDIDFKDAAWSDKTFSQGNTNDEDVINGVYFWCKHATKHFSLEDNTSNGLTFPDDNMSSNNRYFCIPITGINSSNKQITVTLKHGYSNAIASFKYYYNDGRTEWVDASAGSGTSVSDAQKSDTEITFTLNNSGKGLTNTAGHLFIGRNSSSYTNIYGVTVTTPGAAGTCYYVTYNGNGATGGYTTDEAAYASGDNATAATNSFTKTGYTFGGWATSKANADAGTKNYDEGDAISITGNITLFAIWQAAGYTLAWNTNGGSALAGDYSSGSLADGATITAPDDPTRANYTFDSWNTAADGSGNAFIGTMPAANTTYYAVWKNTLTLKRGSQGSESDKSPTVFLDGSSLNGFSAHKAAGYTLQGYYTAATGGTKVLNADGSFAASNIARFVTSGKWSRTTGDTILVAQWESSYLLKWNLQLNKEENAISTTSKESATARVTTASMTNLTNNGGLTITGSKKSDLTSKIETPINLSGAESKYMSVSFDVTAGYQLLPSAVKVMVQPVGNGENKYAKLILEDENSHSISTVVECEGTEKGKKTTVTLSNAGGTVFTGTVTLKILVYNASGASTTNNCYRLGSPIQIDGAIEAACGLPSYEGLEYDQTEYTVGDVASAIRVTGGSADTYQWKWNSTNDRSTGTNVGTNASYTPLTTISEVGTRYYWCELKNDDCEGVVKTPAVAVTVSSAVTVTTVTWSDPVNEPNYGGGGYVIRATVDQPEWGGTLGESNLVAPAGIHITNVATGTDGGKKYIDATFDVTTAFDRDENEVIVFGLTHDAVTGYSAISVTDTIDYDACSGGEDGSAAIALTSAIHDEGSGNAPRYWFETSGVGRVFGINYGKATLGTSSDATFNTEGYSYVASSTSQRWVFQPYVEGVTKIRIYIKSATNTLRVLSIGKNASWQDQSSKYSNIAVDTIIYSNGKTTGLDNNQKGYAEIQFSSALTKNNYYMITMSSSSTYIYGVTLYSGSVGDGGNLATSLTFANTGPIAADASTANFQNIASKSGENRNTLGTITYSSNNDAATVNATTGEVSIHAKETAQAVTITATLSPSGCYQGATATYTINVAADVCGEPSGSIELTFGGATKCSGESVILTMTGFTSGATVEWYNGDTKVNGTSGYTIVTSGSTSTLTTSNAGTYSAIAKVDEGCPSGAGRTNSITISNIAVDASATKIVDKWYVKNGRSTPDIALWSLDEGTHLYTVTITRDDAGDVSAIGLTASDFTELDGVVYLSGKEPSANETGADIEYTLTLTVKDACNGEHEMTEKTITLTHQKNTDKHVLAFVVNGTAKGGFTEGITAAQTTSVGLYNAIAAQFDVLATNIYATDDEKKLKEYYSQYDILCITDYPNTQTKGANSKSYVDAIGSLIDIRPILTMEAFVSKLANWKAKGISGSPKSPTTRQYTMDLQCKDHEIFAGTDLATIGEGDETMYRVSMVDNTKEDYATLDATYGATLPHKEKESKKGAGDAEYNYGGKPALQGFTFTAEMADADLLPIGLIDDGAGNDLQVGIERQHNMAARLMVLGINSYAMERLTDDGERVVINALKYLMKKNAEDIADCSNTFVGGDNEEDASTRDNWNVASHWSGNALPDKTQKVRIVAPCVIPSGVKPHVAGVIIAPRDGGMINHGADEANGSLTIAAGGALIVDGKVEAATAPNYFTTRATTPTDLVLQSNSSAQAALILDNSKGETQATVEMYSPSYWEVMKGTNKKKSYWSYVGVPIQDVPVGEYFYGAVTYLYDETSGWIRKRIGSEFHAFEGIGLSLPEGHSETFYGTLASTETKEITLTKTTDVGEGDNLIGNSWTAPIQIGNFDASDFGSATAVVSMYKTGRDDNEGNPTVVTATAENDGAVVAGQWVSIPIGLPGTDGYDGPTVIPSMQAFQVTTSSETTLTLDYDKLVRDVTIATDNLIQPMSAPKRKMKRAAKKSLDAMMRVRMSGFKTRADLWIMEDGRFSDEYDNGWEANYIECDNRSPQLYANSEIGKMAFLAKPDIEGTILGIAPSRDGNEYLFTFHYVGDEEFYLNDLKLKQSVLISEEESYSFMYEDGDTNRFYISRTRIDAPQTPTGVENTHGDAVKARKFIYNDKLYIMLNGRVYSAEGQLVK